MLNVEKLIWEKLGIREGDCLPFTGRTDSQPRGNTVTRNMMAQIFADAGFKIGAEIGVDRGGYSQVLCKTIPGLKLYCVDPWVHRGDKIYRFAVEYLKGFDVEFIRNVSIESSKVIPDRSLDFVYIDALHDFDNVMTDIILWTPKVKSGGVVSGHDYVPYWKFGVIDAVRGYTRAHNIYNWYLVMGDSEPSWLWVNK